MNFILTNVGVQPEMREMAAALADSDVLDAYITSGSWAANESPARIFSSGRVPGFVARYGCRRILPSPIGRQHVKRCGLLLDMAYRLASERGPQAWHLPLQTMRNRFFDRAVASYLRRQRPPVVVSQATSSLETLKAAKSYNATTVLNYSIAHHRWMACQMDAEASRNPKFSALLQHNDVPESRLGDLDMEVSLADIVLVGSRFVAQTFIDQGVAEEKIRVVPLGADRVRLGSTTLRSQRSNADPFRVIFVGQLTQRKGLSYLLDAFREARLPPGSELVFVGAGSSAAKDLIDREANTRIMGHVSRNELGSLICASDLYVLPSLAEGFPLSAIEAMSLGTPVAVSRNTFGDDVVSSGQDGYVFSVPDHDQLRCILEEAASDRERLREMGVRGQERAREFSWTNYRNRIRALLLEIGTTEKLAG